MKRKIVLKRLSASDLTLFEHHYRNTSGAKQKALNLDVAVFIHSLYPGLSETISFVRNRIPLDISIYGPGGARLHNLQRKILKQQKNWRLNGELIYDPPDESNRYSSLKKGDFLIIEFFGETEPYAANLYLIASALPTDEKIFHLLENKYASAFSNKKGMEILDIEDVSQTLSGFGLSDNHPLLDLVEQNILEDAALGSFDAVRKLTKRRQLRGVSQEELNNAKRTAEWVGRIGEEILNVWLEMEKQASRIRDYRWVSDENAIAPYDFEIVENNGLVRKVDAKSTSGDFNNSIHVSIGELHEMSEAQTPYDIYRLYRVTEQSAKLRISTGLNDMASETIKLFTNLPQGITVDNVSISPKTLKFGIEIPIVFSDIDE